jgi:hypothetical protein
MGETVQASLRRVLIDSHVAAVAIAILIILSLNAAIMALWGFANDVLYYLAAEAAGKPPFAHLNLAHATPYILSNMLTNLPVRLSILVSALVCILAAWMLSRWTYGVGPLRTLGSYRDKLSRKIHA